MSFDKLLTPENYYNLIKYVSTVTNIYKIDRSHGIQHSVGTMLYAGNILNDYLSHGTHLIKGLSQDTAALLINVAAFIHDMMDDKYIKENERKNVEDKTKDLIFSIKGFNDYSNIYESIMEIIDNMSYSKRQKSLKDGKDIDLGDLQLALEIVRDADLLEGYKIDRCRQFSIHNKNKMTKKELNKEVYKIMSERVLKYLEVYISTPMGKKIAEPLHNTLKRQLECYESDAVFIK